MGNEHNRASAELVSTDFLIAPTTRYTVPSCASWIPRAPP